MNVEIKKISRICLFVVAISLTLGGFFRYFAILTNDLPSQEEMVHYFQAEESPMASEVFDRHGRKIGEFALQSRYRVNIDDIPRPLIKSFIVAEDRNFFHHNGFDFWSMVRALVINLTSHKIKQGASTITQQLARLYFLDHEKTLTRKLKEIVLAIRIEKVFSKKKIMELYLNRIYLGRGAYGVEAASRRYFNKGVAKLNLGEATLLAILPRAPSGLALHRNYQRARPYQRALLKHLYRTQYITREELKHWGKKKIAIAPHYSGYSTNMAYVMDYVDKTLNRRFSQGNLLEGGLKVYTTVDKDLQEFGHKAFSNYSKSLGSKKRRQELSGALVALDSETGAIRSLQGGWSYQGSQFNRALYTKRKLGRMYLPLYYSLALDSGYDFSDPVDRDFFASKSKRTPGVPTLYEGLMNKPLYESLPLYSSLGASYINNFAGKLGYNYSSKDLFMALGEGTSTPLQLAVAYSSFFNQGHKVSPYLIREIRDYKGRALYERRKKEKVKVLSLEASEMVRYAFQQQMKGEFNDSPGLLERVFVAANDDYYDGWACGAKGPVTTAIWLGSEKGRMTLGSDVKTIKKSLYSLWKYYNSAVRNSSQESKELSSSSLLSFEAIHLGPKQKAFVPFVPNRNINRAQF